MCRVVLSALLCCAVTHASYAADGDPLDDVSSFSGATVKSYKLCDGHDASASPCQVMDVWTVAGFPRSYQLSVESKTGCTASPIASVRVSNVSGGATWIITTLPDSAGEESVVVRFEPHRYLDAVLSNMSGCTDYSINIHFYF